MKNLTGLLLILLLIIPGYSCRKIKDYFREPETEKLAETIHSSAMIGYAANLAMAMIQGQSFPNVTFSRSNAGFPCTTLMVIDTHQDTNLFLSHEKASKITVAGLWPDEFTAILSLVMTDFNASASTLDVLGIKTIPVMRNAGHITVALASMDIQMNPDQDALLHINLNTLEIESELIRLETPRPADVYVAVLEDAYFIDVYNNSTADIIADDTYTVTGGGQLIKVAGQDVEINQQAMVNVQVSPECNSNPVGGMALMKTTGLEDQGFPELGTVVFEFKPGCSGTAHVFAATGMYLGSNGRNVPFLL